MSDSALIVGGVILRRYCPGCGKLVPDTTFYCPYCGVAATEKKKRRLLFSPNPVVAALSIFVFLVVALWKGEEKTTPPAPVVSSTVKSSACKPAAIAAAVRGNQIQTPETRSTAGLTSDSAPRKNLEEAIRLNLQGHQLLKQGFFAEAIPVLQHSIQTFPEGAHHIGMIYAQYNLAYCLRKTGKPEQALPFIEKCVAYNAADLMFQRELKAIRKAIARKQQS